MPDWDDKDIREWKERATSNQQYYSDRLSDRHYDSHSPDEYKYLKLKIAFSLFGSPEVKDDEKEIEISAYTEDQQTCTNSMFDRLEEYSKRDIEASFIFLMIKQFEQHYQLPVIRFKSTDGSEYFLDHYSRVYKSWDNFTEWNELPECLYCYPVNGWYRDSDENVKLEFSTSPRCNVGEKVVKYADYASIGTTIGSLGLLSVGLLFPPAAPICLPAATLFGATSGTYAVGRNGTKLIDRGYHGQSVNPFSDSQARACWMGAVGGALGVGTLGTARYITLLAQRGDVASKVLRATFNTMNVSSLSVNGLGILTNIYELSQKKGKITAFDVANLTLNILFFTHSAVNVKTARALIKDTQSNVLDHSKMQMDDQAQAGFKAYSKQNKADLRSTMYGNAKTIKILNKIDNPNQFFADLQQVRVDANVNASGVAKNMRVRVNNDLLVSINGELKIHPSKWVQVNAESRTELLECAKNIKENPSIALDHIRKVKTICNSERITFERTRKQTLDVLADKFGVSDVGLVKINGKRLFANLKPYEIDRIGKVLDSKGKNATQDFIDCVTHLAKELDCNSSGEYCSTIEYCYEYINDVRQNEKSMKGVKPSIQKVVDDLLTSKNVDGGRMQKLLQHYRQYQAKVSDLNANASPGFASDFHATYHYFKHETFGPNGKVSPKTYFEIIKEITKDDSLLINRNMSQEGDKMTYAFANPKDGAFCVVIKPLIQVDNDGAFVATLFYKRDVHVQPTA